MLATAPATRSGCARTTRPEHRGGAAALLQARDTIRAALETPGPAAPAALDGILERGRLRIRATKPGAREEVEVEREWRVPWLAVRSLLRLLDEHPTRVRNCANPDCPFWFLDTTRSGTRRWCSMNVCGNRLKARRHSAAASRLTAASSAATAERPRRRAS